MIAKELRVFWDSFSEATHGATMYDHTFSSGQLLGIKPFRDFSLINHQMEFVVGLTHDVFRAVCQRALPTHVDYVVGRFTRWWNIVRNVTRVQVTDS